MPDLLSDYKDLEILCSIDSGGKTGAFLYNLLVKVPQFFLLAMIFLFGVKDRTDLYGFRWTRVSKFDVECPFREIRPIYRAFIAKIGFFIHTDIILQHAGMQGTSRFILIEDIRWDGDYFEYFIFIWGYFDLELHILTQRDIRYLIFTLMNCLQDKRVCSTVLALDDHDNGVIN